MPDTDAVARLARRLVAAVAASNPARLPGPFPLREVMGTWLPYRTSRAALGVDTSEDYEHLLLRFAAGEGGFAQVSPDEVRTLLEAEAASPHPDLAVLRLHGDALLTVEVEQLARTLGVAPEAAVAAEAAAPPPAPTPPPPPDPVDDALLLDAIRFSRESHHDLPAPAVPPTVAGRTGAAEPAAAAAAGEGARCGHCGNGLPAGRAVRFCPHCGGSQTPRCAGCNADVEAGWGYCVTCGAALGPTRDGRGFAV